MLLNYIIFTTNLFTALLFIALGMPLIKDKVKPNGFYGVRTKFSFVSDENWYKINKYGGKVFILSGIVLLLLSPIYLAINVEANPILFTVTTLFILPVITIAIVSIFKEQKRLSTPTIEEG